LSIQVSRRINNWCWWHWSSGFAVALLISAFVSTLLACVAALATIFLASTVSATLAITLLACVALATLAAIAALVASEEAI